VSTKIRWSLRLLGWLLVVISLAPRRSLVEQGPGVERSIVLGIPDSPLCVIERTVIHAGVANLPEEEQVKRHTHFHVASLSMLTLLAGALLVTASNRRRARPA
jgi:hypothetical protein